MWWAMPNTMVSSSLFPFLSTEHYGFMVGEVPLCRNMNLGTSVALFPAMLSLFLINIAPLFAQKEGCLTENQSTRKQQVVIRMFLSPEKKLVGCRTIAQFRCLNTLFLDTQFPVCVSKVPITISSPF
jgi:hypothetical protein